jgi:N-acetylneuraminic acid mutarotase
MSLRSSPRTYFAFSLPIATTALSIAVLAAFDSGATSEPSHGGVWTTLTPAPLKRTEVSAAAVGGKVYVIGGFAEPALSNIKDLAITNQVEEYDPATDRWTTKAPLPVGLHHAGIAVIGRQLYVVGGFTRSFLSVWSPLATLYRFDPERNSWSVLASMPTARGALAATEAGGRLLAVGGYESDGNSAAVELYDPQSNTWSRRAPLPTPRDHLAVAAIGNRVYAIAGRLNRDYGRNLPVTEAYDVSADRWMKLADMPTARSGITAGVLGGSIYVLGGEGPSGTFSTNEAYHPDQDQWTTMATMPTARHGLGSAVVGPHLYVIAGGPSPGGSFSNVNERFTPPARTELLPAPTGARATAQQVGTIMALLAVFQDAGALPPEESPEANLIIKALIQFQAAFMRSNHDAVRRLLTRAFRQAFGAETGAAIEGFRNNGWTSRSLEAIVEYAGRHRVWDDADLAGLEGAFRAYNVGRGDLERLGRIVQTARERLAAEGHDLHAAYAARRQQMPGS